MQLKVLLGLCALSFVSCGVENTSYVPNSFKCEPTAAEISNYQTTVYASLQANNCMACHGNSTSAQAYKSRFKLQTVNQDVADQKMNLCITYMFGQKSPGQSLVSHPQDAKHAGGRFAASSIEAIITWVNTYRLPN